MFEYLPVVEILVGTLVDEGSQDPPFVRPNAAHETWDHNEGGNEVICGSRNTKSLPALPTKKLRGVSSDHEYDCDAWI